MAGPSSIARGESARLLARLDLWWGMVTIQQSMVYQPGWRLVINGGTMLEWPAWHPGDQTT